MNQKMILQAQVLGGAAGVSAGAQGGGAGDGIIYISELRFFY